MAAWLMPDEIDLLNLTQKVFVPGDSHYEPPEQVLKYLRHRSGQDFGFDVDAWYIWFKANTENWDRHGVLKRRLEELRSQE